MNITFTRTCPMCKVKHSVVIAGQDMHKYQNGTLAQNAFPYLTADEREIIISGTCPTCWEKMFAEPQVQQDAEKEHSPEKPLKLSGKMREIKLDDKGEAVVEDQDPERWDGLS